MLSISQVCSFCPIRYIKESISSLYIFIWVWITHLLIQHWLQAIPCIFCSALTPVSPNNAGLGLLVPVEPYWLTFTQGFLRARFLNLHLACSESFGCFWARCLTSTPSGHSNFPCADRMAVPDSLLQMGLLGEQVTSWGHYNALNKCCYSCDKARSAGQAHPFIRLHLTVSKNEHLSRHKHGNSICY